MTIEPSRPIDGRPGGTDLKSAVPALLFTLLGLWMLHQADGFSTLGAVFPRLVATALILCSMLLLAISVRRRPDRNPQGPAPAGGLPRPLLLVAVMAAWLALMPAAGFLAAGIPAFLAMAAVAERRPWTGRRVLAYAVTAVLFVLAIRFVFGDLLLVPLPEGPFF